MKKCWILPLVLVTFLLIAVPVFASYVGTLTLAATTNATNATMAPILCSSFPTQNLVDNNYITSSGLDTRVEVSGNAVPHMLSTDKLLYATGITTNQTAIHSFTTGNSALSAFNIVLGNAGYLTVNPGNIFAGGADTVIEWKGYIDMSKTGEDLFSYGGVANFRVYIKSTTTLCVREAGVDRITTAPAIASGVHTIQITCATTPLTTIKIGGVSYGTWAGYPGAGTQVLVFMDATTSPMPYAEYFDLSSPLANILYQPVAIISGTTMPDTDGAAQNGTITWGTNPTGVTCTLTDFQPESTSEAETDPTTGLPTIVQTPTPDDMYAEMDIENETGGEANVPGAGAINEILDAGTVPKAFFWLTVAAVVTCAAGIATKKATKSLLAQYFVMVVCTILFAFTITARWTIPVFIVNGLATVLLQVGPYRI